MLKRGEFCRTELTTADFQSFCQQLGTEGIPLYEIESSGSLTFRFLLRRWDLKRVKKLCKKRGDTLKILSVYGISAWFQRLLRRPVIPAGILLMLLLFLFLPTRILFIRVTGNNKVPKGRILEAASQCGIRFGTARKKLRSEAVKNSLLGKIPELQWVGVNTRGCVAEISVKEQKIPADSQISLGPASLIAARDGIVAEMTVRSGMPVCRTGQAVKAGEVLISGVLQQGNLQRTCRADGEIYAMTNRHLMTVTPAQYLKKGTLRERDWTITLVLGKKRIKLFGSSGNYQGICGRMYKEYCITLPGGYRLPAALIVDEYLSTDLILEDRPEKKVCSSLKAWADHSLQGRMIAGTVLLKEESFSKIGDSFCLHGNYLCHEMIGRLRQEEIGVKQDLWKES